MIKTADRLLPAELVTEIRDEVGALRADIEADSPPGYSTVELAELIGEVCDTAVRAVSSNADS